MYLFLANTIGDFARGGYEDPREASFCDGVVAASVDGPGLLGPVISASRLQQPRTQSVRQLLIHQSISVCTLIKTALLLWSRNATGRKSVSSIKYLAVKLLDIPRVERDAAFHVRQIPGDDSETMKTNETKDELF
ncbi:hypothetical protein NDU88_007432 [Pleurodeles waltl]|uniref:Uncharacterized protein n=1 Tax=Pleurodeles waltl TaxID=8319 RepID=A0AAV7U020_PLEWA|nr:hypothetical protein NDU88_007432 [Pleurodeles waltl]